MTARAAQAHPRAQVAAGGSPNRDSPKFTLQLASAAAVGELERWLAAAGPGDRAQYAAGAVLPRDTDGVRLVTRWKDAGLVLTLSERDRLDPRRTIFLIEKRAAVDPSPGAPGGAGDSSQIPARAADCRDGAATASGYLSGGRSRSATACGYLSGDAARLLELLRDCAARGAVCPSLGEAAGHLFERRTERTRQKAAHLMRRLVAARAIAVAKRDRLPPVVTILAPGRACGKSTSSGGM